MPGVYAIAVWRSGFDVFHTGLELDEGAALRAAASGDPLSCICAFFDGREDPVRAAFEAMASWFQEGWIAGVNRETPAAG